MRVGICSKLPLADKIFALAFQIDDPDMIENKIHQAAHVIARGQNRTCEEVLDQICINPQCGFAANWDGNSHVTEATMRAKLELLVKVSKDIWKVIILPVTGHICIYDTVSAPPRKGDDVIPRLISMNIGYHNMSLCGLFSTPGSMHTHFLNLVLRLYMKSRLFLRGLSADISIDRSSNANVFYPSHQFSAHGIMRTVLRIPGDDFVSALRLQCQINRSGR
ncbi:hypothetical protein EVG20_g5274 [Dentipellis fragilis]|uniref:Uncharacterized protein n=1 Tax=Dentipellis fragilis TaxID=205917 RepID=A0A4Y9YTQ4_9AGAM|nr:hypothetical protein EVG20_g5274 [Dentipellis fragilis]